MSNKAGYHRTLRLSFLRKKCYIAFHLKTKCMKSSLISLGFALFLLLSIFSLNSCKDDRIVHPPDNEYKLLNYDKIGQYIFDFKSTPVLRFKRVKDKIPIDTIELTLVISAFDTMAFEAEEIDGAYSRNNIFMERDNSVYYDSISKERIAINFYGETPGGLNDGTISVRFSDFYFVSYLGKFGVGDRSDNENPHNLTVNEALYTDVWSNFRAYSQFNAVDGTFSFGSKLTGNMLHYSPKNGIIKVEFSDKTYWERI